jgi:hypothetical protein
MFFILPFPIDNSERLPEAGIGVSASAPDNLATLICSPSKRTRYGNQASHRTIGFPKDNDASSHSTKVCNSKLGRVEFGFRAFNLPGPFPPTSTQQPGLFMSAGTNLFASRRSEFDNAKQRICLRRSRRREEEDRVRQWIGDQENRPGAIMKKRDGLP